VGDLVRGRFIAISISIYTYISISMYTWMYMCVSIEGVGRCLGIVSVWGVVLGWGRGKGGGRRRVEGGVIVGGEKWRGNWRVRAPEPGLGQITCRIVLTKK